MIVALLTIGTRGDSQPMSVLARELRRRGHEVRIGASPGTHDVPAAFGLSPLPLGRDVREILASEEGRRLLSSRRPRDLARRMVSVLYEGTGLLADIRHTCDGADIVVSSWIMQDVAKVFTANQGIPLVGFHYFPYPHALAWQTPGFLSGIAQSLVGRMWARELRPFVCHARKMVGPRAAAANVAGLEIQAYETSVVQKLNKRHSASIVGSLVVPTDVRNALGESETTLKCVRWIESGTPPVLFGFGSMPIGDPAMVIEMIRAVSAELGVRALISAGWGGLDSSTLETPEVLVTGAVDHDVVMPRCAAVVHHGGAGTTAASIRARVPVVICSIFYDQPFWGRAVAASGIGATLRFQDLSHDTLLDALGLALSPAVREKARNLNSGSLDNSSAERAAALIEGARVPHQEGHGL